MKNYLGIDVAKAALDVFVHPTGETQHVDQTPEAIDALVTYVQTLKPALVVLEDTGGYERQVLTALHAAGIPVAKVNPRRIRDFARATGQIAKTDQLDARIIALFAATLQPPEQEAFDRRTLKIKALVVRRRQLVNMRTMEKNRLEHAEDRTIAQSIDKLITLFDREIAAIDKTLGKLIHNLPELQQKADTLKSAPGIGDTTARMLVTELPELGRYNRRQIASLLGLAPMNRDSGAFRGKRMTGGGRRQVRTALYMPTLVAIQHNPVIRAYYQRLLHAGKTKMVALTAAMRKLLIILNTMIAKNEPWNPKFS